MVKNQLLEDRIKYYESIGFECSFFDNSEGVEPSAKDIAQDWERIYFSNYKFGKVYITRTPLTMSLSFIQDNTIKRICLAKLVVEIFEKRIKILS